VADGFDASKLLVEGRGGGGRSLKAGLRAVGGFPGGDVVEEVFDADFFEFFGGVEGGVVRDVSRDSSLRSSSHRRGGA